MGEARTRMMNMRQGYGVAPPLDRFGNPMTPEALVLLLAPMGLQAQIVEVQPILDPRAPTNAARVTLMVQMMLPGGQPFEPIVVLRRPARAQDPEPVPEPDPIPAPEPPPDLPPEEPHPAEGVAPGLITLTD